MSRWLRSVVRAALAEVAPLVTFAWILPIMLRKVGVSWRQTIWVVKQGVTWSNLDAPVRQQNSSTSGSSSSSATYRITSSRRSMLRALQAWSPLFVLNASITSSQDAFGLIYCLIASRQALGDSESLVAWSEKKTDESFWMNILNTSFTTLCCSAYSWDSSLSDFLIWRSSTSFTELNFSSVTLYVFMRALT